MAAAAIVLVCTACGQEKEETEFNLSYCRTYKTRNGRYHNCKACKTLYERERIHKLREQIFNILGHQCVRCGFSNKLALQIDHINGGGSQERRGFSNPSKYLKKVLANTSGYQILCANCNWIKRLSETTL